LLIKTVDTLATSNPPCPHCQHACTNKAGIVPGTDQQRYRCRGCGRYFPSSPNKCGAKPIGDVAMSQADLDHRYIATHGNWYQRKKRRELEAVQGEDLEIIEKDL
jgi:MinD superfamily P-loop ATPase